MEEEEEMMGDNVKGLLGFVAIITALGIGMYTYVQVNQQSLPSRISVSSSKTAETSSTASSVSRMPSAEAQEVITTYMTDLLNYDGDGRYLPKTGILGKTTEGIRRQSLAYLKSQAEQLGNTNQQIRILSMELREEENNEEHSDVIVTTEVTQIDEGNQHRIQGRRYRVVYFDKAQGIALFQEWEE